MSLTTTNELLEVHNHLAEALGKPTLKTWRQSKAKLQARVDALQADAKPAARATPANQDRPGTTGKPLGVKVFIEDRILAGEDDATILAACKERFPQLDWTGNRRTYPRWYRNALDRKARQQA